MNVTLVFYKYDGKPNVLKKTLTDGLEIRGDFNISFDTSDSTLRIVVSNDFDYNYVYIKETGRYYFITRKTIQRNGLCFLTIHIDVLMTYQPDILKAKLKLEDEKTNVSTAFNSDDIVNDDFINIMVTLGGKSK